MLAGCQTTQFSGFSNAPLAQVAVVQHPRINGGIIPLAALTEITYLSASAQQQIHEQAAGLEQSMINGAVPAAGAGAVGFSAGYSAANVGLAAGTAGAIGAITGAANGAWSGAMMGSGSAANAIGSTVRDFWELDKKLPAASPEGMDFTGDEFKGTFVQPITAGKNIFNSAPRNVEEQQPQ